MEQIRTFSDSRLEGHCIYCGGEPESREHVPSKILLDKPYPENLPIVSACTGCNQGFSMDEEYLACLLECIFCGTTDPDLLQKKNISKILKRKPKLKERIEACRVIIDNQTHFQCEEDRIRNVVSKIAKGIAKFENSEIQYEELTSVSFMPIIVMNDREVDHFFQNEELELLPEIGSRTFQRIMIDNDSIPRVYWKDLQKGNFSYSIAHVSSGLRVRMLIWNYLVGEVIW